MKQITRTFFTGLAVTLPVVATLYLLYWAVLATESTLDGLLRFVLPRDAYFPGQGLAVLVCLGDPDLRVIGFVTRDDLAGLPPGMGEPGMIMVYMPMSYQVGGYTALVPRASVQPVD